MKVIIREAAYDDLDRIFAWIANDRPRSADALISRILESAERLGQFPYMGHPGRVPATYEWVIPGLSYIRVYQVLEDEGLVIVGAVFHGAQDREERQ
jgi:plasmid stabilization system protein ParE